MKTKRVAASALFDNFFEANKGTSANEQDVRGVHRSELLVWVLAASLRRDIGNGALKNLQQRLLHALATHIARNRRVLVLFGNLIDLVDVDNALLGLLNIAIGGLQQLKDNVFDVLAHLAGFGQGCGVHNRERHIQHARERLRQKRLARARWTDQKNVGF